MGGSCHWHCPGCWWVGTAPTTPPHPPGSRRLGRPSVGEKSVLAVAMQAGKASWRRGRHTLPVWRPRFGGMPGPGRGPPRRHSRGWRDACPGRGPPRRHSRALQELLLLPVGLQHLLRHQLHQLQALLHLHQDLEVLPAPHLHGGSPLPRPLSLGTLSPSSPLPQEGGRCPLSTQPRPPFPAPEPSPGLSTPPQRSAHAGFRAEDSTNRGF